VAATQSRVPIRARAGVFNIFEAVDYKTWFALAEFVDNSIQSWLDAVAAGILPTEPLEIVIETSSADGGYIVIRDTAAGIPEERFGSAFELGTPPPDPSGLSVYGIGMKSAGAWFARRFRITTTTRGERVERVVEYDFPRIVREGLEELDFLEIPAPSEQHGTEVLLTGLKNPIHPRTREKVRDHLTSIYRNFIRSGDVVMIYDGDRLTYTDPEVLVAPDTREPDDGRFTWRKDVDLTLSTGERIHGYAAIRKIGRAAGSGFSLYRGRRVITGLDDDPWRPTEIFGFGNSYRSQRLFGELHLENVKVAYSKNGFVWQASGEELVEELRKALDAEPLPLLKQAESYRAREPEPRQREAAKRALDSTSEAVGKAVTTDLASRLADQPAPTAVPALPTPAEQISARTLDVVFRGQRWEITVELTEGPDADWITLADNTVTGAAADPRRLGLRLNINTPFMRQFGGTDTREVEAVMRVGAAVALSVVVALEQGILFADYLLQHVNQLLRGSLSR
jgi:Histidine kinase-, DNA gyrase B-, and HSP90-like ATPase